MILVEQRCWLTRDDFVARFVETFPAFADATPMAVIDWDAALAAIDTGGLACSASEGQMLRIAASLATGVPVDLSNALSGLDDHNLGIVLAAMAHAGRATTRLPAPTLSTAHTSPREASPDHRNCMLSHTL